MELMRVRWSREIANFVADETKFGMYVLFPISMMYYFGHPDFYEKYVRQVTQLKEKA